MLHTFKHRFRLLLPAGDERTDSERYRITLFQKLQKILTENYSVSDSSAPIAAVTESSFTTTQQMEREVEEKGNLSGL